MEAATYGLRSPPDAPPFGPPDTRADAAPAGAAGALALWLGMVAGLAVLGWDDRVRAQRSVSGAARNVPALGAAAAIDVPHKGALFAGPGGAHPSDLPLLPYPRLLRQAAGLGRRRAMLASRALWERGPDLDLESLEGIGPKSAESIRRLLFPEEPAPSPYTKMSRFSSQLSARARPGPTSGHSSPRSP